MKDNKKSDSPKRVKLFNKKFFGLTPFLFFLCLILMLPVIAQAASVTLTWSLNQEPDIAGYRIYYGTQSGQYDNSITVYDSANQPLQRSYTVAGLSEGTTYYFGLKAFDQAGQESEYSVETSKKIPGGDGDDSWWDNWYGSQDYLEVGQVDINHNWKTVELTGIREFQNPVVIVGPPTRNGGDPCVVRVRNVTSNSFQIRIQEWLYLDQWHTVENVSYMVVEAGEHILPDGTMWQAGTYALDGTLKWKQVTFPGSFLDKPLVFQTGQTFNGGDTIAIRMKDVTPEGFTVALQEEERMNDGHAPETIGYLAMTPISTDLAVYEILCDHNFTAIADGVATQLAVEEEQSRDTEIGHVKEKAGVFLIKDYVFAQIQTFFGGDTAALRCK
jgi:hypothetical protein